MSRERDQTFLLCVFYAGPWERLSSFFYGLRRDGTLRWELPQECRGWQVPLSWAGDFCDRKDGAWRRRHAARGTQPLKVWKRLG